MHYTQDTGTWVLRGTMMLFALSAALVAPSMGVQMSTASLSIGGHLEGANICAGKPQTILEHTVSPGASGAVLNYFWTTGAYRQHAINTSATCSAAKTGAKCDGEMQLPLEWALLPLWVDYFVDGEVDASVSMQPAMAAGQAFGDLMQKQNFIWDTGSFGFGRNTISTWFNRFHVPFLKTIRVQARFSPPGGKGCHESYFNVRGTERAGAASASLVSLPGYGPLPPSARLSLQRIDNVTVPAFGFAPLFTLPKGKQAAIFLTALSLSAPAFEHPGWPKHTPPVPRSPGNHYMEGCVYLYRSSTEQYPGLVVGTGAEDYFDSSYGFSDPWQYAQENPQYACALDVPGQEHNCYPTFAFTHAGLLHHSLSTWDATERYAMYKSHVDDPLVINDGGSLLYRVGDYINKSAPVGSGHHFRCGTLDPGPSVVPSGPTQPTNVTSYVWAYTWDTQ